MWLCLDVLMGSSKWNVVSCVTNVVERNDVFVWVMCLDVDFVEQRLDVCPLPHGAGGSESESDGECVVVVVELHLVEEDN